MNLDIQTKLVGPLIVQDIGTTFDGVRETMHRQVADTSDAQVIAALVKLGWTPPLTGEAPGHGLPDWPDDLKTFDERHAYQRGVAIGKTVAKAEIEPALIDALKGVYDSLQWHTERHGNYGLDASRLYDAKATLSRIKEK